MSYLIYDLETTGLDPRYDQPVQFAAVRLDNDLTETDAIELLARPQNHILPSPGALLTHGRGMGTVLDAPLSHYQLMAKIEAYAALWAPATWAGYNSIRFDEEFLRHSHYCALRQPYMTQFNGNTRGDIMRLAQLANAVDPGALRVPVIRGKPTFKLTLLAAANGFRDHDAHDALGHVRATAHILRVIRSRTPATWALFPNLVSKTGVVDALLRADFAAVVFNFGAAIAKPILPVCPNPDYPAQWLAIDLTRDPTPLLRMEPKALAVALSMSRSPLCRIKTNGMPPILPGAHPAVVRLVAANVLPDVPSYARVLRADPGFADRLAEASNIAGPVYPPAEHVEELLYEGGFFPSAGDDRRFAAFHAAPPQQKFAIAQSMQDDRARELAKRVMYNEWSQELPAEEYARIDRARSTRLHQANALWTTIAVALAEIAKLQDTSGPTGSAILDEYRSYLRSLDASDAA